MHNKRNYHKHFKKEEQLFVDGLVKSLIDDRQEISRVQRESLLPELELFDRACALFVYFLEKLRRKKPLLKFDEALLILASKMISDAQSMRLILENGWSGTAIGVSRMIWSSCNMIIFLGYYPEHLKDWFSEKHDTYQKDKFFKKLFSEGNILKKLSVKGFVDTNSSFQLLSKGTHASYWGAQVYTDDEGSVTYQPRPDFYKTLVLLSEATGAILALIGWYVKNLDKSFQEAFVSEKERTFFTQVNAKLNQFCNYSTERLFHFLAETHKARESRMGPLLGKPDLAEWEKLREEIAKKGDPPILLHPHFTAA